MGAPSLRPCTRSLFSRRSVAQRDWRYLLAFLCCPQEKATVDLETEVPEASSRPDADGGLLRFLAREREKRAEGTASASGERPKRPAEETAQGAVAKARVAPSPPPKRVASEELPPGKGVSYVLPCLGFGLHRSAMVEAHSPKGNLQSLLSNTA